MVMAVVAPTNGIVHFKMLEGSLLTAGDLVARLDLDDPVSAQVPPHCNCGCACLLSVTPGSSAHEHSGLQGLKAHSWLPGPVRSNISPAASLVR